MSLYYASLNNSLVANLRASAAVRSRRIKLEGACALVCPAPNAREVADFRLRMAALLTELRREFAHRPVILALLRNWERDSAHLDRLPGKPFNAHVVRQSVIRILRRQPELRP